jgi:hypothetical protein
VSLGETDPTGSEGLKSFNRKSRVKKSSKCFAKLLMHIKRVLEKKGSERV